MGTTPRSILIRGALVLYAIGLLVLILLAASNYPVQWRVQVNHERMRYLEVFAQAIQYYSLDHDGALFLIPAEPVLISNTDTCSASCPALGVELRCYNLAAQLVPSYVKKIFQDPLISSDTNTGFYISQQGRTVTLGSCYHFFKDPIALVKEL